MLLIHYHCHPFLIEIANILTSFFNLHSFFGNEKTRFIYSPEPRAAEIIHSPLKGTQILFIICALMFLTLLLLGLGVSYYCLKNRTIPVVRRLPLYMAGSGSEITKLSGSSLGNLSVFEESVKIPRVHVPVAVPQSSSDTLPSDYPSESHSEIEVDIRSLPHSSVSSYENHAYLQEASSVYSENLGQIQEIQAVAVKAPSPQFDVQVRVKRPPPPPPSISSSSSDAESAVSRQERNNLSTIMESHEDRESILTIESLPHENVQTQFTYMPELHPAPKYIAPPTVYSTLNKNVQKYVSTCLLNLFHQTHHKIYQLFLTNLIHFLFPSSNHTGPMTWPMALQSPQ